MSCPHKLPWTSYIEIILYCSNTCTVLIIETRLLHVQIEKQTLYLTMVHTWISLHAQNTCRHKMTTLTLFGVKTYPLRPKMPLYFTCVLYLTTNEGLHLIWLVPAIGLLIPWVTLTIPQWQYHSSLGKLTWVIVAYYNCSRIRTTWFRHKVCKIKDLMYVCIDL